MIGGHADVGVLVGGGSSQVVPPGGVKLSIKSEDAGFASPGKQRIYVGEAPLQALRKQFPQATVEFADGRDRAAAAALAARSRIAIVFAESGRSKVRIRQT